MNVRTKARKAAPVIVAGALLAIGGAAIPFAGAAQTLRVTCTASLNYTANAADASQYSKTFTATSTTPFSEDLSTIFRQNTFDAALVGGDVQINWFKDVNVFDNINAVITVPMIGNRGRAVGSSAFSTSNQPNHITSWNVSCRRI
jgi:hypothetical protein